jgi:quercetin dioxygenase-like cupin family protein
VSPPDGRPTEAGQRAWRSGNAQHDGAPTGGWFVGHFLPAATVAGTDDVELKWFTHPAGQQRDGWATGEERTTVALLISGRFRIDLPDGQVLLETPGDYVMWGPGTAHSWKSESESTMVTIRWPSRLPADDRSALP